MRYNFFDAPLELPPPLYLIQVLKNCPCSALTYVYLWQSRDKECKVIIKKATFSANQYIHPTKLRHDIYQLVEEGLASLYEEKDHKVVELVDWKIDAEGFTLC